jgi:hypothetical protein
MLEVYFIKLLTLNHQPALAPIPQSELLNLVHPLGQLRTILTLVLILNIFLFIDLLNNNTILYLCN